MIFAAVFLFRGVVFLVAVASILTDLALVSFGAGAAVLERSPKT